MNAQYFIHTDAGAPGGTLYLGTECLSTRYAGPKLCHWTAKYPNASGIGFDQPQHRFQEGGFSGTVVADKCVDLSGRKRQIVDGEQELPLPVDA